MYPVIIIIVVIIKHCHNHVVTVFSKHLSICFLAHSYKTMERAGGDRYEREREREKGRHFVCIVVNSHFNIEPQTLSVSFSFNTAALVGIKSIKVHNKYGFTFVKFLCHQLRAR